MVIISEEVVEDDPAAGLDDLLIAVVDVATSTGVDVTALLVDVTGLLDEEAELDVM